MILDIQRDLARRQRGELGNRRTGHWVHCSCPNLRMLGFGLGLLWAAVIPVSGRCDA